MFENLFLPKEKTPDALKSEHLNEGVKPIMTSILHKEILDFKDEEVISEIRRNGEFADYYESPARLKERGILNGGVETYAISSCDENNKWSQEYWNCTGVAMVGTDKETNKEISFLSHQDPKEFLWSKAEIFEKDLLERIDDLMQRSADGTIDAVIFGGHFANSKQHEDSIKRINEICKGKLGFEPVVVTGPSVNLDYETEVYLDTQNRRLYLIRPAQDDNKTNQSYNPSDLDEEKKKWGRKIKKNGRELFF